MTLESLGLMERNPTLYIERAHNNPTARLGFRVDKLYLELEEPGAKKASGQYL